MAELVMKLLTDDYETKVERPIMGAWQLIHKGTQKFLKPTRFSWFIKTSQQISKGWFLNILFMSLNGRVHLLDFDLMSSRSTTQACEAFCLRMFLIHGIQVILMKLMIEFWTWLLLTIMLKMRQKMIMKKMAINTVSYDQVLVWNCTVVVIALVY